MTVFDPLSEYRTIREPVDTLQYAYMRLWDPLTRRGVHITMHHLDRSEQAWRTASNTLSAWICSLLRRLQMAYQAA